MKLELDVETLEFKISPTKKRPMKVDYLSDSREVLLVRRQTRPRRGELLKVQWANVDSSSTSSFSLRDGSRKAWGRLWCCQNIDRNIVETVVTS